MVTQEENRDQARALFSNKGLTYSHIGSREIASLRKAIENELSTFINGEFTMKLNPSRTRDIEYNDDGSIIQCFIRINGKHFEDREAISFNRDGFIGFGGWADDKNVKPFVTAFVKWVQQLKV